MVHKWGKVIRGSGPLRRWVYKRCAGRHGDLAGFCDFPTDTWKDVQRIKWNTHSTLPFFGKEACSWDVVPVSNVKDGKDNCGEGSQLLDEHVGFGDSGYLF